VSSHAPTRWTRRQRAREEARASEHWHPARRPSRLPRWIPAPLQKLIRFSFKTAVVLTLLGLAVALFYSCLALRYDLRKVVSMPERTIILDAKGRELATLHGENRRLISREEVPPFFVEALQAREDKRFFEHHGVDLMGLLRATLRNVRDRSFTQGASTLTMQLARNTFEIRERSLHRKLLEIAITLRIEMHYSKDQILSSYLNRIYFGSGCHGLDEAARTYFGIPASKLNDNQSTLLAGIIRAPHACSPFRNLKGALTQRDEVLDRLVAENVITAEKAEQINTTPLNLLSEPNHGTSGILAPLVQRHFDELLADNDRQEGGLILDTTIDAAIQSALEEELAKFTDHLAPDIEIAALILDPRTGGIQAAVGGRKTRPGRYHRALDARRDLGPVFTPFVLAAAAERGLPLDPDPVATGVRLGNAEMERLAKRFGFTGPFGKDRDLYRGSLSTTPLELATAAATLLNDGQRPRTHLVRTLRTSDGTITFQNDSRATSTFSRGAVRESLAVVFSAKSKRLLIATSPADFDAWGLLLDPRHVVCIWAGADQPKPLRESTILPALQSLLTRLQTRLATPN